MFITATLSCQKHKWMSGFYPWKHSFFKDNCISFFFILFSFYGPAVLQSKGVVLHILFHFHFTLKWHNQSHMERKMFKWRKTTWEGRWRENDSKNKQKKAFSFAWLLNERFWPWKAEIQMWLHPHISFEDVFSCVMKKLCGFLTTDISDVYSDCQRT